LVAIVNARRMVYPHIAIVYSNVAKQFLWEQFT